MFTCVPLVFHWFSLVFHLCSLVFTCVPLVFHLCLLVFYLCSFVFICVPFVFICVHLCSFVFHLCSLVFICVPIVWCFRPDREILYFLIRTQEKTSVLCHCNGCWPFTISIPFILILGSKEVLLSAKNLNLYVFLSMIKGHDWLK